MKRITPLLLLAAALAVVACGGKTLDTKNVEKDLVEVSSSGEGAAKTEAECPSEVEDVKEGKTYECEITYDGNENNKQKVEMKIAANDESEFVNQKAVEDEIIIRQTVAQVDAKPELICEQVSEEILEQLGGEECPQRAQEESDGKPAEIKSIEIEGDTATMVTGEGTTTFERAEGGGWVVTAVE
jgi:hypothetical protein